MITIVLVDIDPTYMQTCISGKITARMFELAD